MLVVCWRADLVAVYTGVAVGYAVAAALLTHQLLSVDWLALGRQARANAGGGDEDITSVADAGTYQPQKLKPVTPRVEAYPVSEL